MFIVVGCSDSSIREIDFKEIIDYSKIKQEPLSRTGNKPYVVYGVTYVPLSSAVGFREQGIASWYGKKFHGRRTSSGEIYDMYAMTAAHKTLPLPTYVSVTNVNNNRKVIVRVNDRGPFIDDRVIDLSYSAARELGLVRPGTGPVIIEALTPKNVDGEIITRQPLKYFISTGVFSNRNYASNMLQKLTDAGFNRVRMQNKSVSGTKMYQVLIGPYGSEQETRAIVLQLRHHLTEEPVLVLE